MDPLQHRPPLPKLDILAVDADEELCEEWEAEDDVKGRPLGPREVKTVREKEILYLWDMEVYEHSTEAEARARTGRNPVGLKWIDTPCPLNVGSGESKRKKRERESERERQREARAVLQRTSFHFVWPLWRLRLSWAPPRRSGGELHTRFAATEMMDPGSELGHVR